MDLSEFESHIGQMLRASEQFGSQVSKQRADLLDRYNGEKYGDEIEDRSQVVATDVADTVDWIMPSLMDIFAASGKVLEFAPVGAEDEQAAEQETDILHHVVMQQNDGFLELHTAIKDALIQKTGVWKWWWETSERQTKESYEGLSALEIEEILKKIAGRSKDYEIVSQEAYTGEEIDPLTGQPQLLFDIEVELTIEIERPRFKAIPPEDFFIPPRHNSLFVRDADFTSHRIRTTVADLVDQGYDEEWAKSLPDDDETLYDNEREARFSGDNDYETDSNQAYAGELMRPVVTFECYIRADYDGDGKAELRKALTGGDSSQKVARWADTSKGEDGLDMEIVEESPFAAITPTLMSHKFYGRAISEQVEDLQRIKTVLWRQMLDNVYASANPSVEMPDACINEHTIEDFLTTRPQKIIRTRGQGGMMREINPPTIIEPVMGAIEYVESARENRTGVTRYNQGLDAESLNQTATGLMRIMTASQMKISLIARVMAETGIKDLFRGLHGLIRRHASKEMTINLRGQWIPVDPRHWAERDDMVVKVGLGIAGRQERQLALQQVLENQKEGIAAQAPVVTWENIHNTLEDFVKAAGLDTPERYWTRPELNPQQPQQQGDPALAQLAQIEALKLQNEALKTQMDAQRDMQKLELERMKLLMQDDRERDKAAQDFVLKEAEIEGKTAVEVDRNWLNAEVQKDRTQAQAAVAAQRATQQPQGASQ